MGKGVYEASLSGNVHTLNTLIQGDPLILDRVSVTCFEETPLHIAALRGHLDFTRVLLSLKPKLATELDSLKRSPLHLASAEGYTEIVRELLRVSPQVCLVRDQDGLTPLHLAAMKGRVEVIPELIRAQPESAWVRLSRGETVLHLCVKYNRLEALKWLVEWGERERDNQFVNSTDDDGDTILHLAAAFKQMETIKYLLSRTVIKANANALNKNGLTALDVLEHRSSDMEIRECLQEAGVRRSKFLKTDLPRAHPSQNDVPQGGARPIWPRVGRAMEYWLKQEANWLEEARPTLMLVATVIVTMAFQAGLNPPGGVWQDYKSNCTIPSPICEAGTDRNCTVPLCEAGTSVMAYAYEDLHYSFLFCNSVCLVASLSIILLLISGFPLNNKFCLWLLIIIMCNTVSFLALTYLHSIELVTPQHRWVKVKNILNMGTFVWIGLSVIISVMHTASFLYWLVKKFGKFI